MESENVGEDSSAVGGLLSLASVSQQPYVSELLSFTLDRLHKEPELLRVDAERIRRQMQEVAVGNYRAFIAAADGLLAIREEVSSIDKHLESLIGGIPKLTSGCTEFLESAEEILEKRKMNQTLLANHSTLLDLLEIPQLMDTCVRNGNYDEALDLEAFVCKFSTMHPKLPVIQALAAEVRQTTQSLLLQLLQKLRSNIQLPKCLRIIGYLRRIGVFSEYEMRMQFLRCREAWLTGILEDLEQRNPYEYLKGMINCHRMHLFDVVNQYRAIFADDTSGSEENYDGGLLFSWAMHQITSHLKTLKVMLPKITEGGSLSNILDQCMYCAMGLGWVGLDFRGLLPSLFEEAILNLFSKNMSTAVENFQLVLDSHRWVPLPAIGFSASSIGDENQDDVNPPSYLMEHPPLAVFINGVSAAMNELRPCAPLSLKLVLAQELIKGLKSVSETLLRYNTTRMLRENESGLFLSLCRAFIEVAYPHCATCFGCCYPGGGALIVDAKNICVFLGYASKHKGYLCLDLTSNQIYTTRHVEFQEHKFPFATDLVPAQTQQLHNELIDCFSESAVVLPASTSGHLPIRNVLSFSDTSKTFPNQVFSDLGSFSQVPLVPEDSSYVSSPCGLTDMSVSLSSPSPILPVIEHPSILPLSQKTDNLHPMITRAKDGIFKPKAYISTQSLLSEPKRYSQACNIPEWQHAMQLEFNALTKNHTWDLVPQESQMKIIGCQWIYKTKTKPGGVLDKYKARVVALGNHQSEGVDYFETFSPVVKHATIRIVLSLAISRDWTIVQLDVNNAFLNGDLQEDVYMKQVPGFEIVSDVPMVCKLRKALYGLKQAPRAWYDKLRTCLVHMGFKHSAADASMFVHSSSKSLTVLLVYVDDIVLTGSDPALLTQFTSLLQSQFALKQLGSLSFFLGIEVHRTADCLHLSQTKYILDLLQKSGMSDTKSVTTPMGSGVNISRYDGVPLSDPSAYRSVIGALQYCTITRPEIAFTVNRLCQFMQQPTDVHWNAAKRVLRYLKGTVLHGLLLQKSNFCDLTCFTDADWASNSDDRRSTGGYCIFFGDSLISWKSSKQKVVSRSSAESEFRALALGSTELVWLKSLLLELGIELPDVPTIYCDNISTQHLARNPVLHARTKHIEIDFHYVRDLVMNKALDVQHVASTYQLADILTKAMPTARFLDLRSKLMVLHRPEFEGE